MSMRIGQESFDRAIQTPNPDAALRISKNTGNVTSASHGFFSRAVRFFGGPTKQDIADNQRVMKDFVANLTDRFGPEVARQALLRAQRGDVRMGEDGVTFDSKKPLTARQVQTALQFASTELAKGVSQQLGMFDPTGRAFMLGASDSGVDSTRFSADQQAVARVRLRVAVQSHAAIKGEVPSFAQMKEIAGRIAKDVAGMDSQRTGHLAQALKQLSTARLNPDQMTFAMARIDEEIDHEARFGDLGGKEIDDIVRRQAKNAGALGPSQAREAVRDRAILQDMGHQLLTALTKGPEGERSAVQLLSDMIKLNDKLIDAYGAAATEVGTDDRLKPINGAVADAIGRLSPDDAKRVLHQARQPNSPLQLFSAALYQAEDKISAKNMPQVTAIGEIGKHASTVLAKLGERAGLDEEGVLDLMQEFQRPDPGLAKNPTVLGMVEHFGTHVEARSGVIAQQEKDYLALMQKEKDLL